MGLGYSCFDLNDANQKNNSKYTTWEVSDKTKRAISSAYLLSHIITYYFNAEENKCQFITDKENNEMVQKILDHLLIFGGVCRDLLLAKPINDLDIACDARELNKIHLMHLKKYHSNKENQSKSNKCSLFRHYLNKFSDECKMYDINVIAEFKKDSQDEKKEFDKQHIIESNYYIRDCDYILNGKFITNIVLDSTQFVDKMRLNCLKISGLENSKIFRTIVTETFVYNGFDLEGQDFDILDALPRDFSKKDAIIPSQRKNKVKLFDEIMKDAQIDDPETYKNLSLPNRRISHKMLFANDKFETDELIEISLPICSTKIEEHFTGDLSINSCMLPLLAVKNVLENTVKSIDLPNTKDTTVHKFDISQEIHSKLQHYIECGTNAYNLRNDLDNKLLTATFKTIIASTPEIHFWRVNKFAIRYMDEGWTINPQLIEWHKQLYDKWILNKDWLANEQNQMVIIERQMSARFHYATNVDEYTKMLKICASLQFNEKLINALNSNDEFKKKWNNGMKKHVKDSAIINVFKKYNYPIIPFATTKIDGTENLKRER